MEKMMLDDFIKYAKEQFACDILVKTDSKPDTFASIFGASFIENTGGAEKVPGFENDLNYENITIDVYFDADNGMSIEYNSNYGLAA